MRSGHRTVLRALLLALVPLVAGCATTGAGVTPSAAVTTAIQGWERWLRVDWEGQPGAGGQIDGYVYSNHGSTIYDVQLLAQGLDGAGNLVSQRIEWVPGVVPSLQRAYFRIPGMPPAARYRVTVWAFQTVESHSYE